MKQLSLILLTFLTLFIGCGEDEEISPTPPIVIDNPDREIIITSSEDELGYIVLDDCFIGTWNNSTIRSSDGNIIIVGSAGAGNNSKMLVVKTTPSGEIIYYKAIHEEHSSGLSVFEDADQNLYITGYAFDENWSEDRRIAVVKLDVDGNVLWENSYHSSEDNLYGSRIWGLSDNEIMIAGQRDGDLAFLKIDSSGQELLFNLIESTTYDAPNGMVVLEDNKILITTSYDDELHLTWYDENANFLRKRSYGPRIKYGRSTIQLNDGNLVTVGKYIHTAEESNVIESQSVLLLKTDVDGEIVWEKEVGSLIFFNDGQSIRENEDGSFVLTGYTLRNGNTDHMLIFVDAEGNEINAKYFTDNKTFRGQNIIKLENGQNIITGGYQGGTFFLNVDNYGM